MNWRNSSPASSSARRATRAASSACVAAAVATLAAVYPQTASAYDVSAPAILQWFDGSYRSMERRAPDVFAAGYGSLWTPPPGRAESGNFSVGYDVYDRFDLGSPGNPTLYGTETGLKTTINTVHRFGGRHYLDLVWNHNGFADLGTSGFAQSGGYPGFVLTLPNDIDGDFHGAFEGGDLNGRVSNLIDIAHDKNYQYIRNPVPGFANNIPAGTTPFFGELANIPSENNRRFYPDQSTSPKFLFDPATNESNIPVYSFNTANPSAGDPVPENATGYLMRNAQWLVEVVGADGFRLDATKHMPTWVLNYYDRAVYRANPRLRLDGSVDHVFSFGEAFTGDMGVLQSYTRKDINPNDPGRIGGNRDSLDFPLFFALESNLTDNGLNNDWRNVVEASFDRNDGFANNGSQGVAFVQSHDSFGPALNNVAHAYVLMRPGNAVVYFNGKEFGGNRDFPKDGRGDALGGQYGDTITTLVGIRNTHGRGNYIERYLDKETLAYERQGSMIIALSNRLDFDPEDGGDEITIATSFAPGTPLIELTGNADDIAVDSGGTIPSLVIVNGDGTVNLRVPRNSNEAGNRHDRGYVIYGLATPQGTLTIDGAAGTIGAQSQNSSNNGSARVTPMSVVTADSFTVRLQTQQVNLLGFYRDEDADGDNALLSLNGGTDVNGNGVVDNVTPGSVVYGFESFESASPLRGGGTGLFTQSIDATTLPEGMNFIEVRAFRHRSDGGPPVYSSWKETVYVDRLKPESALQNVSQIGTATQNRLFTVRSTDLTADNVHVLINVPAAFSDQQIFGLLNSTSQADQIDRDLWTADYYSLRHGNHVATIVTFEITGNYNIQRIPGLYFQTVLGAGLGDLNYDSAYTTTDVNTFATVYDSLNTLFNPAADFNGDGLIDIIDAGLLGDRLVAVNASTATLNTYNNFYNSLFAPEVTGDADGDSNVDFDDLGILLGNYDQTVARGTGGDVDGDGDVDFNDLGRLLGNYGFGALDGPLDPIGVAGLDAAALELLEQHGLSGAVAAPAVPEPAMVSLLPAAGLLLRRMRTRRGSNHSRTTHVFDSSTNPTTPGLSGPAVHHEVSYVS